MVGPVGPSDVNPLYGINSQEPLRQPIDTEKQAIMNKALSLMCFLNFLYKGDWARHHINMFEGHLYGTAISEFYHYIHDNHFDLSSYSDLNEIYQNIARNADLITCCDAIADPHSSFETLHDNIGLLAKIEEATGYIQQKIATLLGQLDNLSWGGIEPCTSSSLSSKVFDTLKQLFNVNLKSTTDLKKLFDYFLTTEGQMIVKALAANENVSIEQQNGALHALYLLLNNSSIQKDLPASHEIKSFMSYLGDYQQDASKLADILNALRDSPMFSLSVTLCKKLSDMTPSESNLISPMALSSVTSAPEVSFSTVPPELETKMQALWNKATALKYFFQDNMYDRNWMDHFFKDSNNVTLFSSTLSSFYKYLLDNQDLMNYIKTSPFLTDQEKCLREICKLMETTFTIDRHTYQLYEICKYVVDASSEQGGEEKLLNAIQILAEAIDSNDVIQQIKAQLNHLDFPTQPRETIFTKEQLKELMRQFALLSAHLTGSEQDYIVQLNFLKYLLNNDIFGKLFTNENLSPEQQDGGLHALYLFLTTKHVYTVPGSNKTTINLSIQDAYYSYITHRSEDHPDLSVFRTLLSGDNYNIGKNICDKIDNLVSAILEHIKPASTNM